MKHVAAFSSAKEDWETPKRFFDALDAEFGFVLDAAATFENTKCDLYWSPTKNALNRDWRGSVWCNPPYGPGIGKWVTKGFYEAQAHNGPVVMLIPARTDTRWWHEYVMRADEIRLIRGRMRFGGSTINAPFPSCIVVFRSGTYIPRFSAMNRILDGEDD